MNKEEIDREIRRTLRNILTYIGIVDRNYSSDATLRTYLERLIEKANR